jgi:hypothetical protein
MFLAHTKREFQNSPEVWIVPKPLTSGPIASSTAKASVVSYFGYQFESPTPEVKEERKAEAVVVLNFSDCAGVAIFKPQPEGRMTSIIQRGPPEVSRFMKDVYGKETVSSDYALRRAILNTTPRDLSPFARRGQIVRNSVLLTLKGAESQRFKNGLYSFDSPSMRGFLEGDVALDKDVVIEAFDHQDQLLTLVVGAKPGKACFGQPELNRIIFSLRPVPPSE